MKLSEIFKNRKREKHQKFSRLMDYLNNNVTKYYEYSQVLQTENRKMQKFLSAEHNLLKQKYVFDNMSEFHRVSKNASFLEISKFEENCYKYLDSAYINLKTKTEQEFLQKNKFQLDFVKDYSSKLEQYEKLQIELKLQVPLKKHVSIKLYEENELV